VYVCLFLTQSSLHRVDHMCQAVGVECVGTKAAVKARVDTQHGVVQGLRVEMCSLTRNG